MQGNDLRGIGIPATGSNGYYGLQARNGGRVDAGQVSGGGVDFTGLGSGSGSSGGNNFSGYQDYTGATSPASLATKVSQAILNLNSTAPSNKPGPQGQPYDLYAKNNNFGFGQGSGNTAGIEKKVYHDNDYGPMGFVNYTTPSSSTPALLGVRFYSAGTTEAAAQRSMIRRISFAFDSFVSIAAGGITLTNQGDPYVWTSGTPITIAMTSTAVTFDPATGQFRYEYGFATTQTSVEASGSLADGRYQLAFSTAAITGANGSPATLPASSPFVGNLLRFHRLFGDVDGAGYIDTASINAMSAALGSMSNQANYNRDLDFNNDGSIDSTTDYAQFVTRKNRNNSTGTSMSAGWDS